MPSITRTGSVVTESELVARVQSDRSAGLTHAFANGCFDVLHVGHVRYLTGAAAEADRLIVAINDDTSVAARQPAAPFKPRAIGLTSWRRSAWWTTSSCSRISPSSGS